ncbi:MAG: hypothetical protein IPN30_08885 [Flavobacteriales bacterium]|nr:hypothetical protein [Flavobacteriales bacterium]
MQGVLSAQTPATSNLRLRWFHVGSDTLQLDSLSVAPGSVHVFSGGLPVALSTFSVDPYKGTLIWMERPMRDSVLVRYRVLPLAFGSVKRNKDPDRLTSASGDRADPFKYEPPKQVGDPFGTQGLNKTGSISRGVLFGNNQDLAVNSTLNLELSGRLTDRIQVLASITDNNIPIQAGGNTLELQDFDQVFIKLFEGEEGKGWSLIAGDFVLQRPKSHFLTYLKKTKGIGFETPFQYSDDISARVGASVAISKGKFARNVIQGIEGVQGPYRLRGNDSGGIIIILSGTERVFIDGLLLVRGQENDYVIDYNTAEITFTAKRLITKDRRITVEFQYSDKNYARSLVRLDHSVDFGKSTLRFNVYSEQDHRNQPLQQQLSDEERLVLREAGDDPLLATVPGVDSTGFADDQVLYQRLDSLGYFPVFRYNTNPDTAVWRITFTQVGAGLGDYVQQEFTPNGRVFRWVAPDTVNGVLVRRGDHAPVRVLVTPRSQQLITIGFDHTPSTRTNATVELAYSNEDRNTFSQADQADDQGYGLMAHGEHAIPISAKDTTLHLLLGARTEAISRNFRFVERYRAVEFDRNWNILGLNLIGDQLIAEAEVGLRARKLGQVKYGLSTFQVTDSYRGVKQELNSNVKTARTDVIGTASWLTTANTRSTDFLRHKGLAQQRFKQFTIGLKDEHERNLFRADTSQRLIAGSYQFHEWEAFLQSPDTFKNKWRLASGQRWDRALREGALVQSTLATSYSFGLDLARNPRKRLSTTFTYRRLDISDSTLTSQRPENTYLARIDHDLTLFKGAAVFDLFYEFGSGLEQRREYLYVNVPAGQGALRVDRLQWGRGEGPERIRVGQLQLRSRLPPGIRTEQCVRTDVQQPIQHGIGPSASSALEQCQRDQGIRCALLRPGLLARGSKDRRNRCTRGHEPVGLRSIGLQPHGLFLFGPQHFLLQPYQSEVEYRSHFAERPQPEFAPERIRVPLAAIQHGAHAVEHHPAMDCGCRAGARHRKQSIGPLGRTHLCGGPTRLEAALDLATEYLVPRDHLLQIHREEESSGVRWRAREDRGLRCRVALQHGR